MSETNDAKDKAIEHLANQVGALALGLQAVAKTLQTLAELVVEMNKSQRIILEHIIGKTPASEPSEAAPEKSKKLN